MKLTWYGKLVNMNFDCKTAQKNYKCHGRQWSKMNRRFQIFTDPPQPRIGFTRKLGEVIAQWLSSSAAAHSSLEHSEITTAVLRGPDRPHELLDGRVVCNTLLLMTRLGSDRGRQWWVSTKQTFSVRRMAPTVLVGMIHLSSLIHNGPET